VKRCWRLGCMGMELRGVHVAHQSLQTHAAEDTAPADRLQCLLDDRQHCLGGNCFANHHGVECSFVWCERVVGADVDCLAHGHLGGDERFYLRAEKGGFVLDSRGGWGASPHDYAKYRGPLAVWQRSSLIAVGVDLFVP
jgi:hypothetical protein